MDVRFGSLVQRLHAIPDTDDSFDTVQAKDGSVTVKVGSNEDDKKFLYSFYNPFHDCNVLSEKVYHPDTHIFFVVGFGLGYQVIALLKKLKPDQKLFIIEPHPSLFKKALRIMDMQDIFTDERVFIIVEDQMICITEKIKTFLFDFIPYNTAVIKFDFLSLYERWNQYASFVMDIKTLIHKTGNDIYTIKKDVFNQIDYLRTSGLGKTFLGTYKECMSFFRERIKTGDPLTDAEIGMLTTYFLFSHESYKETFMEGSRCEA